MDFRELLNAANKNSHRAKNESSVKTYSTVLPPPKKPDKMTVQSDGVKKFLAKKKAEEEARAAEARKQKEHLLQLRAQNTKSNKKAKLMAARTKDNDFSKIKLSEDEILAKKKIEIELQRKHLKDKKERMKARIELEEKEKLLPRKRKRKSKQEGGEEDNQDHESDEPVEEESDIKVKKSSSKNRFKKPPAPAVNFAELLKIAETKMHEPVVIPKKKEEERLMTKKEKKIYEEEQARLRRKQERAREGIEPSLYHKTPKKGDQKTITKKPHVVHVEKSKSSNSIKDSSSSKIKNSNSTNPSEKVNTNGGVVKSQFPNKSIPNAVKQLKQSTSNDRLKTNTKENIGFSKKPALSENPVQKKPGKVRPVVTASSSKPTSLPTIDAEEFAANIERELREKFEKENAEKIQKQLKEELKKKIEAKLQKEMEEKFRISLEEQRKKLNLNDEPVVKAKKSEVTSKTISQINGKVPQKPISDKLPLKKNIEKPVLSQKGPPVFKNSAPKPPPKRPFHSNPYLDPPRRLLEPLIPPKKRRVIEDSDEDDDDSDMNDFIDDGPSVDDENYSQYIKQIFGYDRSKYIDDDDDDIQESSYQEQMKEEMRSTRLGYMEDLEEERKLKEEEKRKKMRKSIKVKK